MHITERKIKGTSTATGTTHAVRPLRLLLLPDPVVVVSVVLVEVVLVAVELVVFTSSGTDSEELYRCNKSRTTPLVQPKPSYKQKITCTQTDDHYSLVQYIPRHFLVLQVLHCRTDRQGKTPNKNLTSFTDLITFSNMVLFCFHPIQLALTHF